MLLSPSPSSSGAPPRISQLLPTVKCSNCNQPVPLNELGEHICPVAPPVPPLPSNNSGGFKERLQGLLSSPATKSPTNPIPLPPSNPSPKTSISPNKLQSITTTQSSPSQPRRPSFANNRRGSTSSFQARSSPLARSFPEDSVEDYFSQKGSSNSGPGASPLSDNSGSHRHRVPSISSIQSAGNSVMSSSSAKFGSNGDRDTARDTAFAGNRNRDTVTSVGAAQPSFISSGRSDGTPTAKGLLTPIRPPTYPSPLSAQNPTSLQPPYSPRTPESSTMSPLSPLAALSSSNATTASTMIASIASSSSTPSTLNGQPSRPSFSSSRSMSGISRNIPVSGGPLNRSVPIPNPSMSPRLPPNKGQSFQGRSPFLTGSGDIGPPQNASSPAPSINDRPSSPLLPFPGSRVQSMTPSIHQPEPDTKIGGEAGMAGVGRRGFAAAARAALFTSNMTVHSGEGRPGGPFLDIAAAVRTTSTPPLTTNTLSPQSPGPVSPATPLSTSPTSMHALQASAMDKSLGGENSFFDKFRDRIPGLGLNSDLNTESWSPTDDILTARALTAGGSTTPRAGPSRQNSGASETSTSSALSLGLAYSASNASSKSRNARRRTCKLSTKLPGVDEDEDTSGSEYGLAYAESTDYGEDEGEYETKSRSSVSTGVSRKTTRESRDGATPTPGPRTDSLVKPQLRPVSGSLYSDDDDDDNDLKNRLQLESSPPAKISLSRANSNASISSASSASSSSSSAAIAKALGLSRSGVDREGYSTGKLILGGPGAPGIARTPSGSRSINGPHRNRSATVSSAKSFRSDGVVRARSGTEGSVTSKGNQEQAMKGFLSDYSTRSPPQPVRIGLRDDGPSSTVAPAFFDSPPSTRGSKLAHRSNTVGVTTPYTSAVDAAKQLPKLPARSKTERGSKALHAGGQLHHATPSVASSSDETAKKKVKVCVRCDRRIEDGRWISIESPSVENIEGERKRKSVLCESCWKNMYLPKCRRCNLPIEKQAVSSSDGQLKGKYHKDCFNCFTCNQPFPDKVFYVYDGRPLCKYHYHEANQSLCAAAICGQPIEGPCAVSHTGDKYHPEHLTCEWDGYSGCGIRLNGEYWELDGRMLCERHAKSGGDTSDPNRTDDVRWKDEEGGRASGARKRMTRFIDLGALGDLR